MEALGGGIKYLKSNKFSIVLMSFSLSINFCMALSLTVPPLPFLINNVLNLQSSWVGIVNAGFPAGFLLGTLYINARGVEKRGGIALYKGIWVVWLGMAMIFAVTYLSGYYSNYNSNIVSAVVITGLLSVIGVAIALLTFLSCRFFRL